MKKNKIINIGASKWNVESVDDALALFNQLPVEEQVEALNDLSNQIGLLTTCTFLPNLSKEQEEYIKSSMESLGEMLFSMVGSSGPETLESFYPVV